jgi:hypothetical protein
MAIKFLKPQALLGFNADDDYLRTVLRYGDTTNPRAQLNAIADYGLKGQFTTKASLRDLQEILKAGRPVPVGFLHHGTPQRPSGGHWALLTGLTATTARFHDPYGELDNVNGGYPRPGIGGRNAVYTLRNWLPRWTHGGEAWLLDVTNPVAAPSPPKVPEYKTDWASVRAIGQHFRARWPQVVAAQWALESGYGKFQSGRNNFFGIKGTPGTTKSTKEFLNGKWVTISDTFKDYFSPQACIEDLIRMWYRDYKGFRGVNRASSWRECCELLRKEGYATDPSYVTKLTKLIEENDK